MSLISSIIEKSWWQKLSLLIILYR
jgi:Beta-lactamase class C and other penicillin binding proteins